MVNGRKRKCAISRLSTDLGVISEPVALQAHIYHFYRVLMGASGEQGMFSIGPATWDTLGRVLEVENDSLMLSFTDQEMDEVLSSMKMDTALLEC
jgi:hypothetical protein